MTSLKLGIISILLSVGLKLPIYIYTLGIWTNLVYILCSVIQTKSRKKKRVRLGFHFQNGRQRIWKLKIVRFWRKLISRFRRLSWWKNIAVQFTIWVTYLPQLTKWPPPCWTKLSCPTLMGTDICTVVEFSRLNFDTIYVKDSSDQVHNINCMAAVIDIRYPITTENYIYYVNVSLNFLTFPSPFYFVLNIRVLQNLSTCVHIITVQY